MENSSQPETVQQVQVPVEIPVPTSTTLPKKRLRTPLLVGGGLLAGICLCAALCAIVFGSSLLGVAAQKGDVAKVIDASMQAMSKKNANQAYSLFSKRAQKQVPISKVEEMLQGANFAIYDGYLNIEVASLTIGPQFNTNPDVPQGTVAKVAGTVSYEGGYKGQFQAILQQEGGEWKIDGINVTVSPQKFEDYLKKSK